MRMVHAAKYVIHNTYVGKTLDRDDCRDFKSISRLKFSYLS